MDVHGLAVVNCRDSLARRFYGGFGLLVFPLIGRTGLTIAPCIAIESVKLPLGTYSALPSGLYRLPGRAGTHQSAQSHPVALSAPLRAGHTTHHAKPHDGQGARLTIPAGVISIADEVIE